jgi:hypothetical protein
MKHRWILIAVVVIGSRAAAPGGTVVVTVTDAERHTILTGTRHDSGNGIRGSTTQRCLHAFRVRAGTITLRIAYVGYTMHVSVDVRDGRAPLSPLRWSRR